MKANSSSSGPEGDFLFRNLLLWLVEGHDSVERFPGYEVFEDLLEEFERRLRNFIHRYDFRVFNRKFEPEDLLQEVYIKLMEQGPRLRREGNIRTDEDFFKWLFVVVHNQYFSMLRRHAALKRDRLRSDKPLEEVPIPAYTTDFEGGEFLRRFERFVETYPPKHQWAVALWLEDYPFRDIAEILNGKGEKCSHVAVRNWVMAIIEAFKQSLGSPPRDTSRGQGPRRAAS